MVGQLRSAWCDLIRVVTIVSERDDEGDGSAIPQVGQAELGNQSRNADGFDSDEFASNDILNVNDYCGDDRFSSDPIGTLTVVIDAECSLPNISPNSHSFDLNSPPRAAHIDLSGPKINDLMPSDARKLFLTAADPRVKFSSKNPIQIRNAINALAGPVQDIQYLKSGNLFIVCANKTQMTDLLKLTEMTVNLIKTKIMFSLALADQSVQGKMYGPNLKEFSLGEILAELEPYKVITVDKLMRDLTKSHVPLYLITFLGTTCPAALFRVACCQYKVDKYIPGAIKCTNCCRFGHARKYCSSEPTCAKCSSKCSE